MFSGLRSIKVKMLFTISVGVALFFVVILLSNYYSTRLIEKRLETTLDNMSILSNEYIKLRTSRSENIAKELAHNDDIITLSSMYLAESDSYKSLGEIIDNVVENITYHAGTNEEIDSIYLYYDIRKAFLNSDGTVTKTDSPEVRDWVQENTGWNTKVLWKDYYSELEGKSYISMMYRLDLYNQAIKTPVYLGVNFDKFAMYDFLDRTRLTENSINALVNFEDNVYILDADTVSIIDLKAIIKKNISILEQGENVTGIIEGFGPSVLKYSPLASVKGGIVHIIPVSDMQAYKENMWPVILSAAALFSLLFLIVLYNLINSDIDKPIKKLIKHMKNLEAGRFSDKIEEKRKDEFGRVFEAYNNMTVEIEKLIQELYQEKLMKKEMELKILQEKINPHFLYNTLDTINWIAMENKVDDISKMVIALSTMYRKTFNRGRDLISIEDVLTSIACYLDIQQIRYGETFTYEIDCDPDTVDLEILNLIIQTLVENAIIHGMEGMKREGKIIVRTSKEGGTLLVEVKDNGAGMEEEKLNLIHASINSSRMESESGLRNVQKRIKLYYGNQYGLEIHSEKEKGTSVAVRIPAVKKSDD